jgi:uncharacterized membrane protein YfcA
MSADILIMTGLSGIAAGFFNATAAGGALLSFLTMVAFGVPPQVANATNLLVMPASFVAGFKHMHEKQMEPLPLAAPAIGTLLGVATTQIADPTVYKTVTPWLIYAAAALLLLEPAVSRKWPVVKPRPPAVIAGLLMCTGWYAGFFGGAVGALVVVALAFTTGWDDARSNLAKIVICLTTSVTGAAGFLVAIALQRQGPIVAHWPLVASLATGLLLGGLLGAALIRLAVRRRHEIPRLALRGFVVLVSVAAATIMLWIA